MHLRALCRARACKNRSKRPISTVNIHKSDGEAMAEEAFAAGGKRSRRRPGKESEPGAVLPAEGSTPAAKRNSPRAAGRRIARRPHAAPTSGESPTAADRERRRVQALLRKERRQRARAETLLEVVAAAASTLSLKKILIQVCDAVARISVADRCSIFLYNEDSRTLQPLMSLGIEDAGLFDKFKSSAGTSTDVVRGFQTALRSRQPCIELHVPGSDVIPAYWVETFELKSLAIYPMTVRDRVVGMMTVDAFRRFVRFPKEEIETVDAIARQAAIIIDNARLFERVQQQAHTDFLTGLPNHRRLQDLFAEALEECERDGQPMCVAMADVDNFKLLNDVHGHLAGDEVLKQIAGVIAGAIRKEDIVGRYGGDEFLFILRRMDRAQGERLMTRVAAAVEETAAAIPGLEKPIPLRISWGLAAYPEDGSSRRALISRADASLMDRRIHERGSASHRTGLSTRDFMQLHPETVLLAESLLQVIDQKDRYTSDHSKQHATLSLLLADTLCLPERQRYALWLGGLLHDIGKIGVPDTILRKPGPLSPEEWAVMRQHVTISESIVRGLFDLDEACEAVASHHEWYDGRGYPRGIAGEEIPLLGRMLAVVDAYSAMSHDRPYRRRLSHAEAVAELRRYAGIQFDPELVEAFVAALGRREEKAA